MSKPIVDGIEKELGERARLVRVAARSELGRELGRRFDVEHPPAMLVFDRAGELAYRHVGIPSRGAVIGKTVE